MRSIACLLLNDVSMKVVQISIRSFAYYFGVGGCH